MFLFCPTWADAMTKFSRKLVYDMDVPKYIIAEFNVFRICSQLAISPSRQ